MKNVIISTRNFLIKIKYKYFWKIIFFQMDPEYVHDRMTDLLVFCGKHSFTRGFTKFCLGYENKMLEQDILSIKFKNPVGLSGGFDKNAILTDITQPLGFGFEEVGSITGEPCAGNPGQKLWRLKKSKSLVVYYGLKNDGCESISKKLANKKFTLPIGINIAKTNSKETAEDSAAIADYFKAYQAFQNIGDYFTINLSCPNAFGGQPFHNKEKLGALLSKIFSLPKTKPVFLKISPDLSQSEIDDIIRVAEKYKVDGFICTNLTKERNNEKILDQNLPDKGGLSGKIVADLSLETIRYIYGKTRGKFVIIGVGGIFTAEDAYARIKAGASLIELITGMIYEGPQTISSINLGLVKLLKKDGYKNISEAIGEDFK